MITLIKRIVWLAFVCVLLLSATAGNLLTPVLAEEAVGVTDSLELRMTIDNTTIIIGQWVNITLTLRNLGSSNITIWFGSSQSFDIYLYDEEDVPVCRWSDGKAFLCIVWELILEPGGTYNGTYRWNLYKYADPEYIPPKPGNYCLVGVCVGWYGTRWPAASTPKLPITLREDLGPSPEVEIHDVAIVGITVGLKVKLEPGYVILIYPAPSPSLCILWKILVNVTAKNEGTVTETFNVTAYYDNNTIGTVTVIDLASGANTTTTLAWDVRRTSPGNYTLWAHASVVPGEMDTIDNTKVYGDVVVSIPGDANGDGWVTVTDLGFLGKSWGKAYPKAGYNWATDWNGDGQCETTDLGILGKNWGKKATAA